MSSNPDNTLRTEIREILADQEHTTWASWQKWLQQEACKMLPNGDLVIPASLANRWNRQIVTPYAELPEVEKESDRKEADKILPDLLSAIKNRLPKEKELVIPDTVHPMNAPTFSPKNSGYNQAIRDVKQALDIESES